ncbi:Outer membrane protein/peptidoglycan-associated (Lipo)protein [Frankia canadensis]|uniref:Outer membrane protein/peptidoglycan-associated (Lipo)protein n=1 Tax=Frankia canadensis TaxID=1836972 RepID=A0A2I2KUW0_9ACTN|nr:OmpA family protein [Frankia canadensis]SNQ49453.1 Outer membrane protein/peptidoglycan-associated (Lipo)protein [Frankia canadensis]SOU56743.1 Outer membrane protein/peptidoglycan-associated (Lipo)protein [Frankia canadensis]
MTQSLAARLNRPRPVAFAVSLLLAWLLLALIAFALRRGPIQEDLAARATAAVKAAGGVHAQVHIEGREAVVTGRFPNAAAAEQARASAAVAGTTSARLGDDVVIASEPARPLVLAVAGSGMSIDATVPDRAARASLLAAVADAAGGTVRGQIRVDPAVAEPPVEAVPALAAALRGVPGDHSATLRGATVAVAGSVPDAAAGQRLSAAVLSAAGATVSGVTVRDQLTVRRSAATGTGSSAAERAAVRAALGSDGVTFPVAGSVLNAAARARLDQIAEVLRAGQVTVLVGGYTDTSGPSPLNQALSLDRAQTAADYLVRKGVPADRVRAAGFGSREPVGDNGTPAGRAANRRIEITPVTVR